MYLGRDCLHAGQERLVISLTTNAAPAAGVLTMQGRCSRCMVEPCEAAWHRLGFEAVECEESLRLVAVRLIELRSKSDSRRLLSEVGIDPLHLNAFHVALRRTRERRCRGRSTPRPCTRPPIGASVPRSGRTPEHDDVRRTS